MSLRTFERFPRAATLPIGTDGIANQRPSADPTQGRRAAFFLARRTFAPALFVSLAAISACQPAAPVAAPTTAAPGTSAPAARRSARAPAAPLPSADTLRFRDITEPSGLRFRHDSGADPERRFPVNLGSGVALFDYDGDGRLDVYLASMRPLPLSSPYNGPGSRLFRGLGDNRFQDVTERAGLLYRGFCHGVTVGDADSDGFPDLFLTGYGPNRLYLNNGDGTFRDATAGSRLDTVNWSSGAAFIDHDRDGDLDLYVSSYGEWNEAGPHPYCGDEKRGIRIYCSPFSLAPAQHHFYRNNGDGTFDDVTADVGVKRKDGRGLGVIAADLNRDGLTDLYVANDGCPKFLFLNRGDGTFDDVSESSGAALNEAGEVQGSMGVDAEDIDGDGWPELFVTNFRAQYNTLYKNHQGKNFQDVSAMADILADSLPWVGWGCSLADLDNDSRPDMFVVNGEVDSNLQELGQDSPYEEPAVVWRNLGGLRYGVSHNAGDFFVTRRVARGAAFGDIDDDGLTDAIVSHLNGPAAVVRNVAEPGHWIRLDLVPTVSNRSAIGARVEIHMGERVLHRLTKGGGSYLSANDPRLLVGLGEATKVDRVEVVWPSGAHSTLTAPELSRTHQIREPRTVGAPR